MDWDEELFKEALFKAAQPSNWLSSAELLQAAAETIL
jgi:hypothetical protein